MSFLRPFLPILGGLLVAGCGITDRVPDGATLASDPGELAPDADTPRPTPRPGEAGDQPIAGGTGGETVASLGDPARPGLWLETPLVAAEGPGRITTEDGRSLEVTLIPAAGEPGSGSRISLAAMQALGLPITALAVLDVQPL